MSSVSNPAVHLAKSEAEKVAIEKIDAKTSDTSAYKPNVVRQLGHLGGETN